MLIITNQYWKIYAHHSSNDIEDKIDINDHCHVNLSQNFQLILILCRDGRARQGKFLMGQGGVGQGKMLFLKKFDRVGQGTLAHSMTGQNFSPALPALPQLPSLILSTNLIFCLYSDSMKKIGSLLMDSLKIIMAMWPTLRSEIIMAMWKMRNYIWLRISTNNEMNITIPFYCSIFPFYLIDLQTVNRLKFLQFDWSI